MANDWFYAARAAKYPSVEAAAKACGVSARLIEYLEMGSVTGPELAKRIGRVLGLNREQVTAITCAASVERRAREKEMSVNDRIIAATY